MRLRPNPATPTVDPLPTTPPRKRRVVFGMIGPQRDGGVDEGRHQRFRPTPSIVRQPSWPVDHLVMWYDSAGASLRELLAEDVRAYSPGTTVEQVFLDIPDHRDILRSWNALSTFVRDYDWKPDEEDYFVHITSGSRAFHIVMYLMTEAQLIPGQILQTMENETPDVSPAGTFTLTDLQHEEYARVVSRLLDVRREYQVALKNGIDTRNPAFNAMIAQIQDVTLDDEGCILLMGPTGAGKSALARRIAELLRAEGLVRGKLVVVNCATLLGDTAMSAIFGHAKGAFSGADRDHLGYLGEADGGVLFLDEIGELSLEVQKALLMALETGVYRPVGASQDVVSNFRLIAGTNRSLEDEVARGNFREDLMARLSLWVFELPSLAERREDFAPNLDYQLLDQGKKRGQHLRMLPDARARVIAFGESPSTPWKRNFRDLEQMVTRLATLAKGGPIELSHVEDEIVRLTKSWAPRKAGPAAAPAAERCRDLAAHYLGVEAAEALGSVPRATVEEALRVCLVHPTMSAAARAAFGAALDDVPPKNHGDRMRNQLKTFGLTWEMVQARRPPGW